MKGGGAYINIGSSSSSINSSGSGSGSKMTLGKSVKMYLTIFIATTCIYMVLYQYHMSREPFSPSEVGKHQEKSSSSSYIASYLWSPISLLMANNLTSNNATTTTTTTVATTTPPLYIITPTYRRPEQLAELTRLGYTLKHVANLLWLVIEDANKTNPLVAHTLDRIGVPYEYMVAPMPEKYKQTKKAKPRGVSNRNRGLEYLRQHATEGVLYFADDDNTYDISIFEQMRYISKVGMWPVGLVTKTGVSSPIIRNGKLDGYYDGWIGGRKYPVDMAGFAVNIKFLRQRPHAQMPFKPGYEEDGFLRSLAPLDNNEIDLLADECRDILTWHTQTKKNPPAQALNKTRYSNTNLVHIDKLLVRP
ncbi:galactosylgalactosylxylosylprotein 3-beta-glucuronosyltransferase P isoform X2 [Drosophila obscura]|uniref:galactosylgalactosylxylosylprotein 3-beta-glucuronosyltransferase P isoform X2 n=1 Tax=Drosophila obscura TaxID=7282 RepID=UPI000BA123CC|nr:galactosylgalactosylxylosylprotein 3-beta-glucuronosyltransferase P isoform X2 [Drosophila obscura]